MTPIPETERLRFRAWTMNDLDAAFRMYGNPQVTRFLGDSGNAPTIHIQRERLITLIQRHDLYTQEGYGGWAMERKSDGEIVGTCLLKPIPFSKDLKPMPAEQDIEVGWHLAQEFWGQGYATEAGRAAIDYGFGTLGLKQIIAVVNEDNTASLRVAERLGMERKPDTDRYYDRLLALFVLTR